MFLLFGQSSVRDVNGAPISTQCKKTCTEVENDHCDGDWLVDETVTNCVKTDTRIDCSPCGCVNGACNPKYTPGTTCVNQPAGYPGTISTNTVCSSTPQSCPCGCVGASCNTHPVSCTAPKIQDTAKCNCVCPPTGIYSLSHCNSISGTFDPVACVCTACTPSMVCNPAANNNKGMVTEKTCPSGTSTKDCDCGCNTAGDDCKAPLICTTSPFTHFDLASCSCKCPTNSDEQSDCATGETFDAATCVCTPPTVTTCTALLSTTKSCSNRILTTTTTDANNCNTYTPITKPCDCGCNTAGDDCATAPTCPTPATSPFTYYDAASCSCKCPSTNCTTPTTYLDPADCTCKCPLGAETTSGLSQGSLEKFTILKIFRFICF